MTFDNLLLERDGSIVTITINRPKVLNALNAATMGELSRAFLGFKDDDSVRVVIITGAGEKAFIAGADINELAVQTPAGAKELAQRGQALFDLIENLGKPVIAAIGGFAVGGGCELAMACTLRLASDSARLGQPEVNLGLIPGYGGSQRLPRLVGKGVALDLLLSGRQIKADEAFRIGLVNRIVPSTELLNEARLLAEALAKQPPLSIKYILEAVNLGLEMPLDQGQSVESILFGLVASTEDMREGTKAFLEKRKAKFQGR